MPWVDLALAEHERQTAGFIRGLMRALTGSRDSGKTAASLSPEEAAAINRAALAKQVRVTLLAAEKKRRLAMEQAKAGEPHG
jgi:hypothetical protein